MSFLPSSIDETNKEIDDESSSFHHIHVDPYLPIAHYSPTGTYIMLNDHTQLYASGTFRSKHCVIILPDMLGWKTGRIRNLCDFFGDHEFFAVIPNFSSKGIEGDHQTFAESSSVLDWYKSRTFDGNIKPIICSILNYLYHEGIEMVSLLGFAWGSWVVANLLASDIANAFQCGILCSPSLDLEERMYGGSVTELMCRIDLPLLVIPTQGDANSFIGYLSKLPNTKVIDFQDVESNYMLRGNADNVHILKALERGLKEIYCFLKENEDKSRDLHHTQEVDEAADPSSVNIPSTNIEDELQLKDEANNINASK